MSILIKGMEMPKNCWDCPFAASSYYAVHEYNKRLEWCCILTKKTLTSTKRNRACPLVPVPPHGRLIDADALPTYDKPIGKMMMFGGEYVYTQTAIDNAPTIIPASEEGE